MSYEYKPMIQSQLYWYKPIYWEDFMNHPFEVSDKEKNGPCIRHTQMMESTISGVLSCGLKDHTK